MKLALLFSVALMTTLAQAATIEQDVDRYLETLSMDQQGTMLESLAWVGVSSPRLYDAIEKQLIDATASKPDNKAVVKKYSHYVRALGFSGQVKYIPTLQRLQSNRYFDDYAVRALNDQPLYEKWNPVISNRATFNPQRSDDVNRFMNMLASDDLKLNSLACKRIYAGTRDDALYDVLEKKVRANYQRTGLSEEDQDGVAWLVKALGSSKMEKYRDLLVQVVETSPIDNAVRHAQRSLDRDYKAKPAEVAPR